MDEVIERLAAGDTVSDVEIPDNIVLVMLARILMTNMAIAGALSQMSEQDVYDADPAGQAGWGGLDG